MSLSSSSGARATGETGLAGFAKTLSGGISKPEVGNFLFENFEGAFGVVD